MRYQVTVTDMDRGSPGLARPSLTREYDASSPSEALSNWERDTKQPVIRYSQDHAVYGSHHVRASAIS